MRTPYDEVLENEEDGTGQEMPDLRADLVEGECDFTIGGRHVRQKRNGSMCILINNVGVKINAIVDTGATHSLYTLP